jgi:hypothetical protein
MSKTPSDMSSEREYTEQNYFGRKALNNYRQKYFESNKIL